MANAANRALVERWFDEGWNRGELGHIDEMYTPDYVSHSMPPQMPEGIEGLRLFVTAFRHGLPDLHMHLEDIVTDGDRAVVRFRATGTHRGELMGIPATGRYGEATGIVIFRVQNGKLAEDWFNWDQFGFFQQLGIIPAPQGAAV